MTVSRVFIASLSITMMLVGQTWGYEPSFRPLDTKHMKLENIKKECDKTLSVPGENHYKLKQAIQACIDRANEFKTKAINSGNDSLKMKQNYAACAQLKLRGQNIVDNYKSINGRVIKEFDNKDTNCFSSEAEDNKKGKNFGGNQKRADFADKIQPTPDSDWLPVAVKANDSIKQPDLDPHNIKVFCEQMGFKDNTKDCFDIYQSKCTSGPIDDWRNICEQWNLCSDAFYDFFTSEFRQSGKLIGVKDGHCQAGERSAQKGLLTIKKILSQKSISERDKKDITEKFQNFCVQRFNKTSLCTKGEYGTTNRSQGG